MNELHRELKLVSLSSRKRSKRLQKINCRKLKVTYQALISAFCLKKAENMMPNAMIIALFLQNVTAWQRQMILMIKQIGSHSYQRLKQIAPK